MDHTHTHASHASVERRIEAHKQADNQKKFHYDAKDYVSNEWVIEKLKKLNWVYEDVIGNKNAITTRVDGVHQIWLQDPDGYWLEINDDQY